MRLRILSLGAVLYFFSACSSDGNGGSTTPTPIPTPEVPATFTSVQQLVLTPSCTNGGCHDAAASGNLVLTAGKSYDALINIPAFEPHAAARGKVRVVPGDYLNSFLMQKLDGTFLSDEGVSMPRDNSTLVSSKLNLIRQWIQDGALNN